ncbi:ATP-binding protein [Robertmurraya massiliosenegalensis]|uniref:ATP-binding protein n=1 Tax=Robertmurraya TaxID=2837507 RepID=UPI0039A55E00
MECNQYVNLPFPYFCIDEKLNVMATAKNIQHPPLNMSDILDSDYLETFRQFIYERSDNQSEVFLLTFQQDSTYPYRIYKQNETNKIHLFCHPLESTAKENFKQMKLMRKNLRMAKLQLQDLEKIKNKYDELELHSSYLSNVGQLAAGIAHEIRNPLTTIKGFIQLIKPYLIEIEKEQYADIALNEIERANQILYQFLNAAKPKMNEQKKINVNELLKDIAILYEGEANLRNIKIETSLQPNIPSVLMEENQLKQVLVNMIKNAMEAIQASRRGEGKLLLTSERIKHSIVLSIKDNGCGLSQESIDKLFTPYYSTKMSGTGLGLSICKQIIHESGGNIEISSRLNEGTTFRIQLPLQAKYQMHA